MSPLPWRAPIVYNGYFHWTGNPSLPFLVKRLISSSLHLFRWGGQFSIPLPWPGMGIYFRLGPSSYHIALVTIVCSGLGIFNINWARVIPWYFLYRCRTRDSFIWSYWVQYNYEALCSQTSTSHISGPPC